MKKIGIFYFSSCKFDFLYQRPQQLFSEMLKLAPKDVEIFYVEPPYKKSKSFKFKIFRMKVIKIISKDSSFYTKPISMIFRRSFYKKILKNLSKEYGHFDKKVAITCLATWEPILSKSFFDLICYDFLDSLDVHFSKRKRAKSLKMHESLVEKSQLIFVTAKKLEEEIKKLSPSKKTIIVSNGVNCNFFQDNKDVIHNEHNKKIIGYVGAIYNWIDVELIFEAARRIPDFEFQLIGPLSKENETYLDVKPDNVHFLGEREYSQIPSYINQFDVALIPFKLSSVSDTTNPIKLFEYFSLGKPVVATDMFELKKYDNGRLLKIARTPEEFVEAIHYFVNNINDEWSKEREAIAIENSWSSKAKMMLDTINQEL